MIVSKSRQFVFVHIPKTGGTAFRAELAPYHDHGEEFWWVKQTPFLNTTLDHGHLRSWEVRTFYPDVWAAMKTMQTLCFFRNPAERFVSAIYEHFRLFRQHVSLENLAWEEQKQVVREFGESVDLQEVVVNVFMVHFSPQTWFTHLNKQRVVRSVVPMLDGFDALRAAAVMLGVADTGPSTWTASPRNPRELLGDELLQRVRHMYAADYAFCAECEHLQPLLYP